MQVGKDVTPISRTQDCLSQDMAPGVNIMKDQESHSGFLWHKVHCCSLCCDQQWAGRHVSDWEGRCRCIWGLPGSLPESLRNSTVLVDSECVEIRMCWTRLPALQWYTIIITMQIHPNPSNTLETRNPNGWRWGNQPMHQGKVAVYACGTL